MKIEVNGKYTIETEYKKGTTNYDTALHVFKRNTLIGGTYIKNNSTPTEIFSQGFEFIKSYESPEKNELEKAIFGNEK